MKNLKRQLREDLAMRDAARALLDSDVEHVRSLVSPAQLREQAGQQVSDKAGQALQVAGEQANAKKGYIAAAAGALILWLARSQIQALFDTVSDKLAGEDGPQSGDDSEPASTAEVQPSDQQAQAEELSS